jgi:flagellar biosynthetic protein FlhB
MRELEKSKIRWIDLSIFADPEKTEKATPRRRKKAREEGNVSQSPDLNMAISLLSVSTVVYFTFAGLYHAFTRILLIMTSGFGGAAAMSIPEAMHYLAFAFSAALSWLLMVMIVGLLGAALPSMFQTRFLFSLKALVPDLNKLNPIEGFKKMFSLRTVFEFIKSLIKMIIIAYIGYVSIVHAWPDLFAMSQKSLESSSIALGNFIYHMIMEIGLALLVIGILDIYYQRWEYERSLRMTKKEVKDEAKDTEGNPLIKNKQRQKMMLLARSRMMENIQNAQVVVTNPTHVAVAIEYKESMNAPKVVAKGAGEVAERIKSVARKYGIPILRNPPLARELFKSVEIGEEIPSRLYRLVAELLVTVYKMKNKA